MINLLFHLFFWTCLTALVLVWVAYPLLAALAARLVERRSAKVTAQAGVGPEMLSVVIAAHNEEKNIEARVRNLIAVGCHDFAWEIIVMADGCEDATVEKARAVQEAAGEVPIRVFETSARGRANAHNEALEKAAGSVLVFTDAETEFEPGFLDQIGHVFDDPEVGFASGQLGWKNRNEAGSPKHFSLYWRFELWLRAVESRLGILATGTGACCAVRKSLMKPVPATEDVDFTTPIDVVMQGTRVVFHAQARAWDYAASNSKDELRARIRMTAKNFAGTIRFFPRILRVAPGAGLGLMLHKLGRWLTPFFFLVFLATGSVMAIMGAASVGEEILMAGAWLFLAIGLLGWFFPSFPLAGQIWSFILGNVGFALGVAKALRKRAPANY